MTYQHKTGQGSLFTATRFNQKSPDFTGTIRIGDTDFKLAAWWNKAPGKPQFLAIRATAPEVHEAQRMLRGATRVDPQKIADVGLDAFGLEEDAGS